MKLGQSIGFMFFIWFCMLTITVPPELADNIFLKCLLQVAMGTSAGVIVAYSDK